jgi:hypothetical protein
MINYKNFRVFNKTRHRLPLGKDTNGKMLYPHDYVRVKHDSIIEYCSPIHWNALDGAFIDSSPGFRLVKMDRYKELAPILRKWYDYDNSSYIIKISYIEYTKWIESLSPEKQALFK